MSVHDQQFRRNAEAGTWAAVGISTYVSYEEISEAADRFWSKCQLAVDKDGKVYRTTLARKRPTREDFDFRDFNKQRT